MVPFEIHNILRLLNEEKAILSSINLTIEKEMGGWP
jgi:hypothetical protein